MTPVSVIAAIDDNHDGDVAQAHRLIDLAAEVGCDAVKFTTSTVELCGPQSLLDRAVPQYRHLGSTWREVRTRLTLSPETHAELKRHAEKNGLAYLLAPGDLPALTAVRELIEHTLYVDDATVTHLPFLDQARTMTARVYACVGACTDREVHRLLTRLEGPDLVLIHSILDRGGRAHLVHLRGLDWLRQFGHPVGHRDLTKGALLATAAVLLGATSVEKRLTLDRAMAGPHHEQSLLPSEFRDMVQEIRALVALPSGEARRQVLALDLDTVDSRPSLVAQVPIRRGTVITSEMVALKPPQRGLSPHLLPWVVGQRAAYDIDRDDFITFGLLEFG